MTPIGHEQQETAAPPNGMNPRPPGEPALDPNATQRARGEQVLDDLTVRLGDPKVARGLTLLLDNAEHLATIALMIGGVLERGNEIAGNVASGAAEMKKALGAQDVSHLMNDGKTVINAVPHITPLLAKASDSGIFEALTASTMFDPDVIDSLTVMSKALCEASESAVYGDDKPVKITTLIRALRDPAINRALKFCLTMAAAMGRELDPDTGEFHQRVSARGSARHDPSTERSIR
ncbi:DUF1641 domain-containing protein [Devriesea agamarum]|uniref:DUF1641 domain-containing protein n=1 Tax=Devriesea agamarum TaxID=472569 RepID=UPI00071E601C|nr:DUF1641 domain-containing protein [Devriesea agamarum]